MERLSSLKSDPPADSLDDLLVEDETVTAVHHSPIKGENGHWARDLEARVDVLESALFDHATVLRDRVAERLDRLEATLDLNQRRQEEGFRNEATTREERIVELTDTFTRAIDRVTTVSSAIEDQVDCASVRPATNNTLTDLVDALTATRSHLDTIAVALQQTRSELKG